MPQSSRQRVLPPQPLAGRDEPCDDDEPGPEPGPSPEALEESEPLRSCIRLSPSETIPLRQDLASRWQRYSEAMQTRLWHKPKKVSVDRADRKQHHNWWWNKGTPAKQITLSLRRGDTSMNKLHNAAQVHPLVNSFVHSAVGEQDSDVAAYHEPFQYLTGKVKGKAQGSQHESAYNIKFISVLEFRCTFGYSRYKDGDNTGVTHAWIMFGEGCTEFWQQQIAADFLMNIAGHQCVYGSDEAQKLELPPDRWQVKTQPLAGASSASSAGASFQPSPAQPSPAQPSEGRESPAQPSAGMPSVGPSAGAAIPLPLGGPHPHQQRVAQPQAGQQAPPQPFQPLAEAVPVPAPASQLEAALAPIQFGQAQLQPQPLEGPTKFGQVQLQAQPQPQPPQPLAGASAPPYPLPQAAGPPYTGGLISSQPLAGSSGVAVATPAQAAGPSYTGGFVSSQPLAGSSGVAVATPAQQPLPQAAGPSYTGGLVSSQPLAGSSGVAVATPAQQLPFQPPQPIAIPATIAIPAVGGPPQPPAEQAPQMPPKAPPAGLQLTPPPTAGGGRVVHWAEEETDGEEHVEGTPLGGPHDVADVHEEEEGGDRPDDSEAEDLAFARKVRAVRRSAPKQHKFAIAPRGRFRAAVGAEVAGTATLDLGVHMHAWEVAENVTMDSYVRVYPSEKKDRNFVERCLFEALTDFHTLVEKHPHAFAAVGAQGGHPLWQLTRELPDLDYDDGTIIDELKFQNRWEQDPKQLLKHLFKKHEGEVVELEGWDVQGSGDPGEIPEILFHPQFALSEADFLACKGKSRDKGKGKSKGKGKKGMPAVGGKGKQGRPWSNRAVKIAADGSWTYRQSRAISLNRLMLSLGHLYTAARLYRFWCHNTLLLLKRVHSWGAPERDAAAKQRHKTTGYYGFGRS